MWLDRNTKFAVAILLVAAIVVPIGLWWDSHRINTAVDSYVPVKTAEPSTAAFLGDYYTTVGGASSYWKSVSSKLCWNATAFGTAGSGYTTGTSNKFVRRLDAVVALQPDIVVVEGSTNDRDVSAIGPAAHELLSTLRRRLPDATVIAVGPTIPLQSRDAPMPGRVRALKEAAQANDVTFVDASEFLPADDSYFQPDELLPNDKGLRAYGEKLADAIPAELNHCG